MKELARRHAGKWSKAARAVLDRSGSTAVEFALLVPPFLGLVFSVFEVGWFYFANSQLDAATLRGARFIRTGQVAEAGLDKQQFFNAVCPPLKIFGQDCGDFLTVEVREFQNFKALAADKSAAVCTNDDESKINAIKYEPGNDGSIIQIRLCMVYKTFNPALGVNLSDSTNGTRRLYGTYLFRNEPYSRKSNSSAGN